ncbi:MAG: hypothetical protein R3337_00585 [Gammaproteobacteria bacterium]|nr:hypothetical protein [Gammaproteobacteria bacterium]
MSKDQSALSDQWALLDQLVTWEHELEVLKELESDLEVEKISAEVALKAAASKHGITVPAAKADEIARTRVTMAQLEAQLEGRDDEKGPSAEDLKADIDRMRAGRDALEAWRDAPETVSAWRRPRTANTVLIIACGVAVWAAVTLHPVYLVLLVPLVMAIGYFTFTAQDADWVRIGAVRRFQGTRLKPPSSWERATVDGRIVELSDAADKLEKRLAETEASQKEGEKDEDNAASELALSMKFVEASDAYRAALKQAGIDPDAVDEKLSAWLDLVSDLHRIECELEQVGGKRVSLSRQAEDTRDALFRFLVLAEEAPPEGHADSQALRAGLERVAKREV